ncbi:MAG: aryl-sulfate sulfotransferase [Deltaproteobacteria bacterium]|nr:aryl-sulfate sulfotransferase [Deltaproteobacteria bacterium]
MFLSHTTRLFAVILLAAACSGIEPTPAVDEPAETVEPPAEKTVAEKPKLSSDKGPGRWRRFKRSRYKRALDEAIELEKEQLEALGYLQGSTPAGELIGVTRHDRKRAHAGLNLYIAGHEPAAYLIDMRGVVLHRWAAAFEDVWPSVEGPGDQRSLQFWRRVRLFDNGDLLAIWDGHGLVRFDKNSRVIWKQLNAAHHDLDVGQGGEIYVLSREAQLVPRVNQRHPIIEDFVLVLDSQGNERRRVSLIEAFEKSKRYGHIWRDSDRKRGDVFHTNTLELLDGSIAHNHPAFAAGNVLISIRFIDAIAVVDLDLGEPGTRAGSVLRGTGVRPALDGAEVGVPWLQEGAVLQQHLRHGPAIAEWQHADHRVGRRPRGRGHEKEEDRLGVLQSASRRRAGQVHRHVVRAAAPSGRLPYLVDRRPADRGAEEVTPDCTTLPAAAWHPLFYSVTSNCGASPT